MRQVITIKQFTTRFSVKCKYDEKIVQIIRKIDKRYWNKEKMEWTLPIEAMNDFIKEIQNLGFNVQIIDHEAYTTLTKNGDKIDVKFATFVDDFEAFRNIENSFYDRENKKFIIPKQKMKQLITLLTERDIKYALVGDDQKIPNNALTPVEPTTANGKKSGRKLNMDVE